MHNRIWNKFHLLEGYFLCLVQTTMPKPCEIYNALVAEVALQTHHIVDSGGDPDTIYWSQYLRRCWVLVGGMWEALSLQLLQQRVHVLHPNGGHSHKHRKNHNYLLNS